MINKIKKWNWSIYIFILCICILGSLSNKNYENLFHAFIFGLIFGNVFGLFMAILTRED